MNLFLRGPLLEACITRINGYLVGWFGFFGICSASEEWQLRLRDAHIRRRLRAIVLKHWKRKRTIVRKLIALGVYPKTAWRRVYEGQKSIWALSHDLAVDRGLRNAYFVRRGFVSLADLLKENTHAVVAPEQHLLPWG